MTTTSDYPRTHNRHRHPAKGETSLYLVRHGQTESNVQKLLHGSTDVPLDPYGIRQAHLVAERLAKEVDADVLVSSPLNRALSTARIIGHRIGLEPHIKPGLSEMDFGAMEGTAIESIIEDYPEIALRLLDFDDFDLTWPKGESRRQFHTRVYATFQALLAEYASHSVIVVAHGGVIGSLIAQVEGVSPNNWLAYQIANCGLSHLHITADHTAVHCVSDVVHLELLSPEGEE
ncbi:MAG: histidine phosphatase family protein [Thermomicrobiales bacterium]